jgi:hypothetical protein
MVIKVYAVEENAAIAAFAQAIPVMVSPTAQVRVSTA